MATYLYDAKGRKVLYVTAEEFAEAFQVTRQTVRNWIAHSGLPAKRITGTRGPHGIYLIPWVSARNYCYKAWRLWSDESF